MTGPPHEFVTQLVIYGNHPSIRLAHEPTEVIMTSLIRVGLFILFFDQLIVGGWNAQSPETFYLNFPTVDLTPPFSEHYARDFGGATLGIAFLLGLAFMRPTAHFVIPAALAFSIYSVPHFFYHAGNLEGTTVLEAIGLTSANAIVALIGVGIILITVRRDRRAAAATPREGVV